MRTFQEKNFTYKNQNCEHKKFTRNFLIEKLHELKLDPIRYCGLPALSPVLEEFLMNNFQDLKMFLAEINPQVHKQQKKIFKGFGGVYQEIVHHKGDLLVAQVGFPLNFVWFDLCGMLTKDTIDKLSIFFQRNPLLERGLFAITWTSSRERGNHTDLYAQLQKKYQNTDLKDLKDFKREQVPQVFAKMLSDGSGRRFRPEFNYQYKAQTLAFMQFTALSWG